MTNRKDLIDPALLRPGRLEVHVEIGLPTFEGRVQILSIHTNTMKSNGFLSDDVDLAKLADLTKNFTGAELEGLVKSASSFALEREVDINNLSKVNMDPEKMRVTWDDFMKALNLPSYVYNMLPYIVSLIVLALTSKKSRAPKAEGIPYDKGSR